VAEEPLLSVRGLTKRFGGLVANDSIDLTVARRGVHALIGPNGAGKTTFIAQLCGELMPDSGSVRFCGEEITRWPPHRRARAGLMRSFQITSVMPTLTALEHALLAAQTRSDELARQALRRVGLAGREDVPAHALSHGERRQLELAMVIAPRPRLLLLDEPAAGAGEEAAAFLIGLLRELASDYAILLVEHDMDLVFAVADWVSVLANGACIATGTPREIRDNRAVRTAYLGD
jgi:branched-chain amino acid transport system ATP-binding protein